MKKGMTVVAHPPQQARARSAQSSEGGAFLPVVMSIITVEGRLG